MKFGRFFGLSVVLSSALAFAGPKKQAPPPPSATEPPSAEEEFHWQEGPKTIDLGHEIQLALPTNYVFLGMPEADRFLRKNGSFDNKGVLGVVTGADPNASWGVIIDYDEPGHVDDKEKIDAPALLKAIREGTEEGNKERVEHGFPELHVGDWSEAPHYDHTTHRLVWGLPASSVRGTTINYNTRVLGRRGVVSLNLLSDPAKFDAEKVNAATLLAATTFKAGARYEDFDKKTDKVAEYGLMGLILGGGALGAAKLVKIGLLAKFGKVFLGILIAGKKLLIGLFALIAAFFGKVFGRKKQDSAGAPPDDNQNLPPTGTG
jgi:uncharacterized membrane-anchored protein